MKKKIESKFESLPFKQTSSRRSMISRTGAMLGAYIISSVCNPASAQTNDIAYVDPVFDVKKYGSTGRREDNATTAFRNAIEASTLRGGGTINVPPGEYTVGTIELKDNITLHLEAGATLFLSQSKDDFRPGSRSMIFAENAKNIAVTGNGTLDGLAQYKFVEMEGVDVELIEEIEIARKAGIDMRRYYRTGMQTFMFVLNNCKNIQLCDISIINSPLWTVRLNDCDRVTIHGVYIYSDLEKGVNADGIDICSTSNVTISDSIIITADDSIVLKTPRGRGQEGPINVVENIVVTNCILSSSSTALMIGTETFADIRNVLFNNCTIRNSNKGFGINVQDGATISNVIFSNLTIETNRRHWNWWGSAEMCKFILSKRTATSKLGKIKDIFVSNIIANTRGTSTITGHTDQALENIRLTNVQLFMNSEDAKDKRATDAIKIKGVNGLKIRDLSVNWAIDVTEEKWRSALVLKNISDFEINSFSGRQGIKNGKDPAILLDNVTDGTILDSRATEGTNVFIHLQGNTSKEITLRGNNKKKARKDISFGDEGLRKSVDLY